MPSPKVSLRVEPEKYAVLVKLARTENKSMTDLVKRLIDEALARREEAATAKGTEQLQKRMEKMLGAVTKLLNGTFEQSAKAHFYGRLGIEYSNDVITYLVQKQELDKASKEVRRGQAEKEAEKFAKGQMKYL
jgi:hypothetical protein